MTYFRAPLFLICCCLAISHFGFSQFKLSDFEYGIKAGTNVADLRTDRSGLNVRATYNIGFIAELKINERWSFSPELIYTRQGEVDRGVLNGIRFDNSLLLDYVALPLHAKFYLAKGFAVESGPQIAYLIRADQSINTTTENYIVNQRANYTKMDVLYNLGLVYTTDWGFFVGLRYSHGLVNVLKEPTVNTNSQRHAVYQFNFGFFL